MEVSMLIAWSNHLLRTRCTAACPVLCALVHRANTAKTLKVKGALLELKKEYKHYINKNI